MYEDELSSNTLYSTTYSIKVQNEIQQFFKAYQGFNYKKMKNTDGAIDDLNMNPEQTEEWNQTDRKENIVFIVLKGKTYKEQFGLNQNNNSNVFAYLKLPKYIGLEHRI